MPSAPIPSWNLKPGVPKPSVPMPRPRPDQAPTDPSARVSNPKLTDPSTRVSGIGRE